MQYNNFQKRLAKKDVILMDGGMGTEILNRGIATTLPLWSAEALLTHPATVQSIYEDYIRAGAEIIITNTFATTKRVFARNGIGEKASEAVLLACKLARQARDAAQSPHEVFIAGSVAPLEDCYSPELTPPQKACEQEHLELAQQLQKGGVDFILLETMITLRETRAAMDAAKKVGLPFAVSFCCNNKLELLGKEPLSEVIAEVEKYHPLFVGVNCVSTEIATKTLKYLREITTLPICVYAQGDGEPDDDQGWKFTEEDKQTHYITEVKKWIEEGAAIVGGCCGTTPGHINDMQRLLVDAQK